MKNIFIKGNSKMGDEVYIFNLPALKTCRPSPWCRANCYALKGNFRKYPHVRQAAEWRYKISKSPDFVDSAAEEIRRRNIKLVRLHSSGDFYSEEYARKWFSIAWQLPYTFFRTSTKRTDFVNIICEINSLPNFIVRESVDPSNSKPMMGIRIAAIDSMPEIKKRLKEKRIYKCINDCEKCGYFCWYNRVDVCFPKR